MNFVKYSATGNDFLIFNESYLDQLLKNPEYVKKICCRRTGVGSDGILFFLEDREHDFGMRYLNADGGEVGMCGNGARSLVHYAFHELDRKKSVYTFRVIDKLYEASVANDMVSLRMTDYSNQEKKLPKWSENFESSSLIHVGVPHTILFTQDLENIEVEKLGREYAHDLMFPEGCNINFVEILDMDQQVFKIRTYERGVEAETLSCGTGVTAAAIAIKKKFGSKKNFTFKARGGELIVKFNAKDEIFLCGNAKKIYNGVLSNKF